LFEAADKDYTHSSLKRFLLEEEEKIKKMKKFNSKNHFKERIGSKEQCVLSSFI
jgi:hypothetical protein